MQFAPDETLGVFAADQNSPHLGNAIQNSWALSLDMHQNISGKINDAFDEGVYQGVPSTGNVYISSGYPGEESTYLSGVIGGGYRMPRTSVDVGNMSYANDVGMWHHLGVLYTAPKDGGNDADVTYWFNDIFEDGSKNTNTGATAVDTQANPKALERTYPVDLTKLHVNRDADGKRLVRWGLVGRDDSGSSKLTVTFENASPVIDVDIKPQIIDVTQDNRVLTPENLYVNSNDVLIIRYTSTYNSGISPWSSVKSYIKIPDEIHLNDSDYGSITFGDTTHTITNPTYGQDYLQYKWPQSLDSANKNAVMDINANVQAKEALNVPINASGDNKTLDISDAISKELNQEFTDGKLNDGDNTVTVYSRDSLGNKSNTLTFIIKILNKTANLVLDSNDYEFNDMQAMQTGLIERKGTWKVNVYSVNSGWSLSASAGPLTLTSNFDNSIYRFDGEMVYKDGQTVSSMTDQVPIASSNDDTSTATTVIGSNWSSDDGILLKSNGDTDMAGQYNGVINWDLVQAP